MRHGAECETTTPNSRNEGTLYWPRRRPSDQKSSEELLLRKRVEELTQENARLKQPSPTTTNSDGDLALKYDALRREYKLYRANALKALQEQKALAADAAKGLQLADLGGGSPRET